MTARAWVDPFDPRGQVFIHEASGRTRNDASHEDEQTLRLSFGLSSTARREQRRPLSLRPVEPWRDDVAAAESGSDWWEAS